MLKEELSVLNQIYQKEESLLDRYSKENNLAPVYKSIYDEAQTPIYKQSNSVLDSVHNALSNSSELNAFNQNYYFNIKGNNLGEIGVLERMAGFVSNREDLDFSSISLAETYKDKALDTKVMGGLYNFTLSDIYTNKDSWLRLQGAYTFGSMIKGKDGIESDNLFLEDSVFKSKNENTSVFKPKNNLSKFMSDGLLNKTDSLENSSIYQIEEEQFKKNEKQISMQDLIDKKLKEDLKKQENYDKPDLIISEKLNKKELPIYSGTNVYQEDFIQKKEKDKKKKIKENYNLFNTLKKRKEKQKNIYGLNIDTLKQTIDSNQKKFETEIKEEEEKIKLKDNHNIDKLTITSSDKKTTEKIDFFKEERNKKEETNKKEELLEKKSFNLNLQSNKNKEIKKINFIEEKEKKTNKEVKKEVIIKKNISINIESNKDKKKLEKINFFKEEEKIEEEVKKEEEKIELRKENNFSFLK